MLEAKTPVYPGAAQVRAAVAVANVRRLTRTMTSRKV